MQSLLSQAIYPILFLYFFLGTVLARTPHPCYYANDTIASDELLPCYGSAFSEHYSCCRAGDTCMEQNACYDGDTGVLYQYGCTDSTFQDSHCPSKCHLDTEKSHWVGLVFCNATSEVLRRDTWLCHHPDNCGEYGGCADEVWDERVEQRPQVSCEYLHHYTAFVAPSTPSFIAVLPYPSGTESWWDAHTDRYQSVNTPSTTPPIERRTTSTMAGFTYPSEPPTPPRRTPPPATSPPRNTPLPTLKVPEEPLRTSAGTVKLGMSMGIGIGLGVPLLLGLAGLAVFYLRRQHKKHQAALAASTPDAPEKTNALATEKTDAPAHYSQHPELSGTPISELPGSPHPSGVLGAGGDGGQCQSPASFVSSEMVQEGFARGARMSAGSAVSVERTMVLRVHELPV